MCDTNKFRATLDRPATQHERDIVRWLLEHGDPRHLQLASQIEELRVISKCTCGCPTVDFLALRKGQHLISDELATVDGQDVGVMLFECDGRISTLEVYSCAGSDKPFDLPAIESMFRWEDLSNSRR
jgi:hypothetical protein